MTYQQAYEALSRAILGGKMHWGELVTLCKEIQEKLQSIPLGER